MPQQPLSPDDLAFDREHLWHPYATMPANVASYGVESAQGVHLHMSDGRQLIDGMASWWSAIHGYGHPALDAAAKTQIDKMSHVMFGGLTHGPAIGLAQRLVEITPDNLSKVFLADSGSVAVEVAIKMALQYQRCIGQTRKTKLFTLRGGYHGDTFGAMASCDPENGMHHLFQPLLAQHVFADRPDTPFGETVPDETLAALRQRFEAEAEQVAAVIVEPIIQGAGGMRFYSADYLRCLRELCDAHGALLILDEIATGFGRSGELFACHHAGIEPDILCVGKAITGGYMTLAATLCSEAIAHGISEGEAGALMHGPTFMGNPLACAVACASIDTLLSQDWQGNIRRIEAGLKQGLAPLRGLSGIADVRVLGAIGVVEMREPVRMPEITQAFVDAGVWMRPFGKLVYTMPPYIISDEDLAQLCAAIVSVCTEEARA